MEDEGFINSRDQATKPFLTLHTQLLAMIISVTHL
uniref:Uncharacterized protein n=1 Tax=Rhizophora mucronata TaxID=61149 RepID=A0A2P2IXM6_RHIMU